MTVTELAGYIAAATIGLIGVVLGALITGRSEGRRAQSAALIASRLEIRSTCVEFLASYRQFRRFLMTSANTVRLVEHDDGTAPTPVIDNPEDQWIRVDNAVASRQLSTDNSEIRSAALRVRDASWQILKARSAYTAGQIPKLLLSPAIEAEAEFVAVVNREISLMFPLEPNSKASRRLALGGQIRQP